MIKTIAPAALFMLCLNTGTVTALEYTGIDQSTNGHISAGAEFGSVGEDSFLFGDFAFGAEFRGVTAQIAAFGEVGRRHETYVTLGLDTDLGHLELGVPKPAFDRFATSQDIQFAPHSALLTVGRYRSRATQGAFEQSDYLPIGLTLTGDHTTGSFAVSVHHTNQYDETVAGIAGAMELDIGRLELGAEYATTPSDSGWNTKAVLIQNAGDFSFSIGASYAQANDLGATTELAVSHQTTDRLSIRAFHQHNFKDHSDTVGASLGVDLNSKISLHASRVHDANKDVSGLFLARQF